MCWVHVQILLSKRPKHAQEDAPEATTLKNVLKTLTEGLPGRFTNQNLRRTGATRLFQTGIEEDPICRKTGHRSNAVRT